MSTAKPIEELVRAYLQDPKLDGPDKDLEILTLCANEATVPIFAGMAAAGVVLDTDDHGDIVALLYTWLERRLAQERGV